jgi:hypothetical protein
LSGAAGPPGAPGAPGAPGDAAVPAFASRLVWKDRVDATIHVVARYPEGSNLNFEISDEKGFVWRSDGWGTIVPFLSAAAPFLFYASTDCSGTAYFSSVIPPGYVLAFDTDGGAYRTVPNIAGTALAYNSTRILGQGCTVNSGTALPGSVPYSAMLPATPIVKPASLYTPPIRPVVQ